jgi:DNA-binding NarL/FixJ family response regulator
MRGGAEIATSEKIGVCNSEIKVLIVEDHPMYREGLVMLLENRPPIKIEGTVENGDDAIRFVNEHEPQVVLLDVRLPDLTGSEVARRILARRPQTKIIGLSMHDEDEVIERMREAGCNSYFNKMDPFDKLLSEIRRLGGASEPAQKATATGT